MNEETKCEYSISQTNITDVIQFKSSNHSAVRISAVALTMIASSDSAERWIYSPETSPSHMRPDTYIANMPAYMKLRRTPRIFFFFFSFHRLNVKCTPCVLPAIQP